MLLIDHNTLNLSHNSHNASDIYPIMQHFVTEMCTHAHFCYKMLYCGICDGCIVGFVQQVFTIWGWCHHFHHSWRSGPRLDIKTIFPRYGDSHVKDKTVARPSYLQHGDPYTGKTASLYWDGPLDSTLLALCHWWIPSQRASYTEVDVYRVVRLHELLNKQSSCILFEMHSCDIRWCDSHKLNGCVVLFLSYSNCK